MSYKYIYIFYQIRQQYENVDVVQRSRIRREQTEFVESLEDNDMVTISVSYTIFKYIHVIYQNNFKK